MKNKTHLLHAATAPLILATAALLFTGCHSTKQDCTACSAPTTTAPATTPAVVVEKISAVAPVAAAPAAALTTVRIKAGASTPFTDGQGNVWLAGAGFTDGETVDREDSQIANTTNPGIYRSERYSMTSFSYPVTNGKYTVKLHFCETYEGISAAGERLFNFNVAGHEFKKFDVFAKAGGALRAYVETVPVEVTDGKLVITFEPDVENPQINGVEILPAQ